MKKIVLFLLVCLSLRAEWVLLDRIQQSNTTEVVFTDIFTDTYEDYMFVVDIAEPLGGLSDVVMQFSTDDTASWLTNHEAGISSFGLSNTLASHSYNSLGIPVTDRNHAGYYFTGNIQLSNARRTTNNAPITIQGNGVIGSEKRAAFIYGTVDITDPVDAVRL